MDPDACFESILYDLAHSAGYDDLAEVWHKATNLNEWLCKGGHPPNPMDRPRALAFCASVRATVSTALAAARALDMLTDEQAATFAADGVIPKT